MNNISEVFTARGCTNKCKFCAVRILEPKYFINDNWKDSIDLSKKHIMIHDNNLITGNYNHFVDVINYIKKHQLITSFDNGFDCRKFNKEHLENIKDIKFERNGLRFAFDNMSEDIHIQRTIKMCLDASIPKSKLMIYVLFNFEDTFDEAMYRMEEIKKLGVRPYPQQFRPLNDIDLKNTHIGKHWDKTLLRDFRFYWMMPGIYTKMTWEKYQERGGEKFYRK